jgi:hypothetical protein
MGNGVSPGSVQEALEMLRSAMGYLATADAAAMASETRVQCLRALEQISSIGTVARTSVLGAFAAGQDYSSDADYSARAWLIHKTGITQRRRRGLHRMGPAGGRASAGHSSTGRRGDVGVIRPDDLHLDL